MKCLFAFGVYQENKINLIYIHSVLDQIQHIFL